MSKLKGIKQSKEAKKHYFHPIINILLSDTPMTKEEIGDKLNVTSERKIRDIIAVCSMHYPVIATSSQAGYRRAKDIENLEGEALIQEMNEVEHQINELRSRIDCLKKKLKPLIAWMKVAEKKQGGSNE